VRLRAAIAAFGAGKIGEFAVRKILFAALRMRARLRTKKGLPSQVFVILSDHRLRPAARLSGIFIPPRLAN
jgi:hypothetical protein